MMEPRGARATSAPRRLGTRGMAGSDTATFGALLRRYRMAAGLSQAALAERAQLSTDAITALERGRRTNPRWETVSLLVAALELDAEDRQTLIAAVAGTPVAETAIAASLPVPPALLPLSAALPVAPPRWQRDDRLPP